MAEGSMYSLADIGALMNNRGYGYGDGMGFGGGYGWWIIILFFALWGNNGWGNNRNGGVATTEDVYQGLADNRIMGKLDGITNGLCDGFYANNTTQMQNANQLQRDLCQGFAAVNAGISENRFSAKDCCCGLEKQISENRFAAQQCCCETNRNIDAVRYENSRNTCDIVRAIEKDGETTRALINQNVTQALRDKVMEQSQAIQSRDYQLSQLTQNNYLVNTLKPCPIPAYITCSPFESYYAANRGYGYNGGGYNGCGCGGF